MLLPLVSAVGVSEPGQGPELSKDSDVVGCIKAGKETDRVLKYRGPLLFLRIFPQGLKVPFPN